MKVLLITLWVAFATHAFAESEDTLADAIAEVCGITDEKSFDNEQNCMIYYLNCVVGKAGKWEDKDLFRCMKEKPNVREKSKSPNY